MTTGFYWHGISGDKGRADMLGQWFVDDPAGVIAKGLAEAQSLGLRYMLAFPCGYNRATADVQPDGSRYLINSNAAMAMLPSVFSAMAGVTVPFAVNLGWHAANEWRTRPHSIATMPKEAEARAIPAPDRRKWVRLNLSPIQAATNVRWWAFDGSEKDPAGLAVAEAELRRDEAADCYGELPPTLPGPNDTLLLDTATMLQYPTLGWIAQWDFPASKRLHYSRVPAGIECHLICLPVFGNGYSQPPTNFPDLREIATAKANGYTIGLGSGWPLDMAKRILAVPPASPTDGAGNPPT